MVRCTTISVVFPDDSEPEAEGAEAGTSDEGERDSAQVRLIFNDLYYNSPLISMSVCLSVCPSLFANYRSQFLLDHLGRYLKLFVSTVVPFSHASAS